MRSAKTHDDVAGLLIPVGDVSHPLGDLLPIVCLSFGVVALQDEHVAFLKVAVILADLEGLGSGCHRVEVGGPCFELVDVDHVFWWFGRG